MTNHESCADCRYFLKDDQTGSRCRRYPPTVSDYTHWPAVQGREWCGEFQRATQP